MDNWNRRNKSGRANSDKNEYDDLLVFGYSSRIFPVDNQSDFISEERHMVQCLGDPSNRVDRYDCRLLLSSVDNLVGKNEDNEEICPTEAMEEDMCDEERYMDMYKDIKEQKEREEEEEKRRQSTSKASIGFDYGTNTVKEENEEESDSEDEPFEPPEGMKFPVGLFLPPNMKLHHIIERTASFVVANGAQMEIVIKAKQRNNLEQFGFLDFDHQLYPFYKYIQKLIREKKYVPGVKKIKKKSPEKPKSSALAAIAKNHASDSEESDSDSDFELHPSLLSKNQPTSEKPKIGPNLKPNPKPKPEPPVITKDISQRNDVYASLFKNIAHVTREIQGVQEIKTGGESKKQTSDNSDGRQDDPEYREWFEKFYHYPCPWIGPKPMLPPTPDVEPVVNSYAEYVARKGVDFEKSLAARPDLQLHFMDPKSPYYSYYHHRVRMFQWQMTQEYNNFKKNNTSSTAPAPESQKTIAPSLLDLSIPPPNFNNKNQEKEKEIKVEPEEQVGLNRKQRRRLLEVNRVGTVAEPGVIDPIAIRNIVKTEDVQKSEELIGKIQPFSVAKSEEKSLPTSILEIDVAPSTSVAFDPDVGDIVSPVKKETESKNEFDPPAPPSIPNNTQLDRKEKARIFMEKLLQEKRLRKLKEEEEERKKIEMNSTKNDVVVGAVKVKTIDDIINSRISSLLSESGFEEEKEKSKQEVAESEKKRKKHRKRSRSRDSSSEDRRRSRYSSHRRRSRSRSRSRSRRERR
ncbi:unnamed protein product [Caenorhabditis angaria]|uniref:SURP motif domain-containing protein n=1 Tax=Caenorhabditis angaria TaxID=860376 RepID=A0A9P1IIM2_9PELO|nr:unnamed protein product [Caenorhabditis angaria]